MLSVVLAAKAGISIHTPVKGVTVSLALFTFEHSWISIHTPVKGVTGK